MTQKINWIKTISRRETPIRSELIARGASLNVQKLLGTPNNNFLFYYDHGQGSAYFDPIQIKAMGEKIAQNVRSDPHFLKNHTRELLKQCSHLIHVSKNIGVQNVREHSIKLLLRLFDEFIQAHFAFSPYMMTAIAVEKVITQLVKNRLLSAPHIAGDIAKADEYLNVLLVSDYLPDVQKEQIDFCHLVTEVKEKDKINYSKAIREHWLKYRYLAVYSPDEQAYSLNYYKKKFRDAHKDVNSNTKVDKNSKQNNQILKEMYLDKDTASFVSFLKEYTYLRTFRVEQLSKAYFFIQPLLREIARRAHVTLFELCLCSIDEMREFLHTGKSFDPTELVRRKKTYLYVVKNGTFRCYSAKQADDLFRQEVPEEIIDHDTKKIKGMVASRGEATGKAHVIFDTSELSEFKQGEILVTVMTNPDFTVIMNKAAAIVTDEGGVTCHAAIVSRELGVPCIVGTGNATKVIQSGDLIYVDAIHGIVIKK